MGPGILCDAQFYMSNTKLKKRKASNNPPPPIVLIESPINNNFQPMLNNYSEA